MGERSVVVCVLCLSILLFQCNFEDLETDKISGIELSPELAVRVGEKVVTVGELIEEIQSDDIEILTDDEMLIHFIINQEIDFGDTQDVISVMTITNSEELKLPIAVPALPFEQTIPFENVFVFEFNGTDNERIDSIFFKSGSLEYDMVSDFPATVDYEWTIIKTREVSTNLDLTRNSFLAYSGSTVQDSYSRSLVGLKSIIEREGDLNIFRVDLSGNLIVPAGQGISADDKFQFDLTYKNPEFSVIYGYFNSQELSIDATEFELGAFEEFSGEGLYFGDPSITLEITNSFGIEVLLNFDEIRGEMADGNSISLTTNLPEEKRLVKAPRFLGESATTIIEINNDVSNLGALLSSFPERMTFAVSAEMNPAVSTFESNFVSETSTIEIKAKVDIPLQVKLDDFEVDFEIETEELSELEGANSLLLQIIATNEIPFEGTISLDFLDDRGQLIVSPKEQFTIDSPVVPESGRVTDAAISTSEIALNEAEISALLSASKIVAKIRIGTFGAEDGNDVKIFSDYELKLEVGVMGEVIIEL